MRADREGGRGLIGRWLGSRRKWTQWLWLEGTDPSAMRGKMDDEGGGMWLHS